MESLKLGQIVHFVQQLDGQVGTTEYAALVSRIHEEHHPEQWPAGSMEAAGDAHADGDVTLFAFMESAVKIIHHVPYSAERLPNTWHWQETDN